jgi:hypothetical protein
MCVCARARVCACMPDCTARACMFVVFGRRRGGPGPSPRWGFCCRRRASKARGSSLPVLLSKTMAGWLLTTLLTHPLDVVAARAAAGRPRGQKWEWTGAWPSMAYVMLGLPVRVILVGLLSKRLPFFDLAVRCGASLRTAARGALAPALAARLEGAACRPQAGRHGAAGLER